MKFNKNLFCSSALTVLFALASIGCSSTASVQPNNQQEIIQPQQTTSGTVDDDYLIRVGDEIELLVWEQPSFNTSTTVSRAGTISIPLVGEVDVVGKTRDQVVRDLERRLSEYIRGEVNITLTVSNIHDIMVSVFGKVHQPDNYPVVDQTSIFNILASAGGTTDDANIREIKIYRQGEQSNYIELDLLTYIDTGHMDSATIIYPGDIIYVPRKQNSVREASEYLRDVVILFGIFRVFN